MAKLIALLSLIASSAAQMSNGPIRWAAHQNMVLSVKTFGPPNLPRAVWLLDSDKFQTGVQEAFSYIGHNETIIWSPPDPDPDQSPPDPEAMPLCLEVFSPAEPGENAAFLRVQVDDCEPENSLQKWTLEATVFDGFMIRSKGSGKCLSITVNMDQSPLTLKDCDYRLDMSFISSGFIPPSPLPPSPGPSPPPPSPGPLPPVPGPTEDTPIRWLAHANFVLSVDPDESGSRKPVWFRDRCCSSLTSKEFFQYNNLDRTILETSSGLCLDAYFWGEDVGVNKCDGDSSQKWSLVPTEYGLRIQSDVPAKDGRIQCLSAGDEDHKGWLWANLFHCDSDATQSFSPFSGAPEPTPPRPGPQPGPSPTPGPSPSPGLCGKCKDAQDHCYTEFGFADSECKCQNNDNKCGDEWYMWVCNRAGKIGFIDDKCQECHGWANGPCPSESVAAPLTGKTTIV